MNYLRDIYQSMWGIVEYATTVGTFDSISPRFWKLSDMANRELDFLGEKVNENIPIRLNQIRGYIDEYDNRVRQDAQNKHVAWMSTYRPNGWYLMKGITLEYLYDNGTKVWDDTREDYYEIETDDVMNDSVINLEHLKYLLENGGLEYATTLVKMANGDQNS